jgi:hypothetical protein
MMFGSEANLAQSVRRILGFWIGFLCVSNFLSLLPHWHLHLLSWVNYSLFFLMAVASIYIARKELYFADVFWHFSILFILISLSIFIWFTGKQGIVGNNFLYYYLVIYSKPFFHLMFLAGIFYLAYRYVLWRMPNKMGYILSWLAAIVCSVDFWYKALTVSRFPFRVGPQGQFWIMLRIDIIGLLLLASYFIIVWRLNRPTGSFINLWLVGLSVFFSCDLIDMVVSFNKLDVYGIDQYFSLVCLVLLVVILFLRLICLFSDEYRLKEQFIFDSSFGLSIPVIMTNKHSEVIIEQLKHLFSSQNFILQFTFGLGLVLISGFTRNPFVTVKSFMMVFLLAGIWNLYYHVFYKRSQKPQILNQKFINQLHKNQQKGRGV